jgi:DNA polymerase-3 subunit beta
MHMSVERDELLRALSIVAGLPPAKSDIPILTHLAIVAAREGGTLRATDMERQIVLPFMAQVKEAGRICVPARLLHSIVKRLPEGKPLSMTLEGEQLRVVCGRSRFQLSVLPEDDYPQFATAGGPGNWQFELEADRLRLLLAGVRHAIAKDESRYYLGGVYLHCTSEEPARLRAVATNGHVLALQSCPAPAGAQGMPGVILPGDTVAEMLKLLPDSGESVMVSVAQHSVLLDLPGGPSLHSKLIDGVFPDYVRVIPQEHPHRVNVAADALAESIGRVATLCSSDYTGIIMLFDPKGSLTVTVDRSGVGSGRDRVVAVEIAGAKTAIGFNCRYLAAMLASYAGGMVEIRYLDADSPIMMTLGGTGDVLQVLMPMRANVDARALEEAA